MDDGSRLSAQARATDDDAQEPSAPGGWPIAGPSAQRPPQDPFEVLFRIAALLTKR